MELTKIVQGVNVKLAGELLTYDMMKAYLDDVIDDINTALDAKFPVFSEFNSANFPTLYPNYNFFPDAYIRKVVILGAAYKYYITDEEGIQTAQQYSYDYMDAMFAMTRDYLAEVPVEWQADHTAAITMDETDLGITPFDFTFS